MTDPIHGPYTPLARPLRPLTTRQVEVAELLAAGNTYREIGDELGIRARTVKKHVQAIAELLPNPHRLPAGRLVLGWAEVQVFEELYTDAGRGCP